jgi:hypothetical protein
MKGKFLVAAVTAALAAGSAPLFAADIGVSVSIGQPGFYGRVDIGDYPQPQLLYRQPRIIGHDYGRAPIYLNVPPGHAKHWDRHCAAYNACGERVYFVQNSWYEHQYVPRYQQRHGDQRHDAHGDDPRGGDHGNSHGNGNGHGNKH